MKKAAIDYKMDHHETVAGDHRRSMADPTRHFPNHFRARRWKGLEQPRLLRMKIMPRTKKARPILRHGYPPAIIRKRDRLPYIKSLEKVQLGGAKTNYAKIIIKSVDRSLDIYLKAARGEDAELRKTY